MVLDKDTRQQAHAADGRQHLKHAMKPTHVGLQDAHPQWIRLGQRAQHGDVALGVARDVERQRQLGEPARHGVLKDGAADGDTDGHAEGAHEGVHAGGAGAVLGAHDGLDAEVERAQHHAAAEAEDGEGDGPHGGARVLAEQDEQARAHGRDRPPGPDEAPEVAEARDEHRHDGRAGQQRARRGEEVDAGGDGGFEFHGHEVEGRVVE